MRDAVKLSVLGLIPARGGSKRVPNKNLRKLAGKSLIEYTFEAALRARSLDKIIVTTDSAEIARFAEAANVHVPFLRPAELAQDNTPDRPVIQHAIEWLRENENWTPACVVLLRPTTPFKSAAIIDEAVGRLRSTMADAVRTVTRVEGVHHPYWMFKVDSEHRAMPVIEGLDWQQFYQRQLLPNIYRLNGVVDVVQTKVAMKSANLYGDDIRLLEVPEKVSFDIDSELDFQICEYLLRSRKGNGNKN